MAELKFDPNDPIDAFMIDFLSGSRLMSWALGYHPQDAVDASQESM